MVRVRSRREERLTVVAATFVVMMAGLALLLGELWRLQVRGGTGFDAEIFRQSVRRVRLPAVRGRIFDAKGTCLADSVPNYCIAIYTEELRAPRSASANVMALIEEIRERVGRAPDVDYRGVREHVTLHPERPLVAWKRLSDEEIVRWRAAFERWTAPPKGSLRRRRIPGLDLGRPVQGRSIVIDVSALARRRTTTAANTLETVCRLSERLGLKPEVSWREIKDHIYARRPLPLMAWKHADQRILARWADLCSDLTATDVYCRPERHYPAGEAFAHLVGFALEAPAAREVEGRPVHYDLRGLVGKKGLEGTYDRLFRGRPGVKLVQIDVSGFRYRDLEVKPPVPGGDLELAIDANVQRFAMEALARRQEGERTDEPVRGAAVVLDPNNGDVLALVSSPTFDPNAYMQSKAYRRKLLNDPCSRAFDRAVYGQYPPGSTFKPIAALGVLKVRPDYASVIHDCVNPYYVGKRRMRCWIHKHGGAHGPIDLRQALMHSCNVYMFEMVRDVGYGPIGEMARQFGLGQYAGLFPDLERASLPENVKYGNLPVSAQNEIDACNMAIGQGRITASPLQMAMAVAAIANGGTLYRPHLLRRWRTRPDAPWVDLPPSVIRRIGLSPDALATVRGGMYDVVQHAEGTAKEARVPGVEIAGKTGSAQYRVRVGDRVETRVYTWMISFAPFDAPRYAVAMLVENGVSGGHSVGPRLSAFYRKLFEYDGTLGKEERP